jgi:hypothetical protein
MAAALGGELRAVTPSAFVRLLRRASGLEVLSALGRKLSRILLGLERRGEVRFEGGLLQVLERRSIWGRALSESTTLLTARELVSISMFDRRAELAQSAGLGALAAGTLLGTGLLTLGLRVPGLAPSLLALGLCAAALGGLVDFVIERSLARAPARARSKLRIVPTRGPAWLLSGLPPEAARAWLAEARTILGELGPAELGPAELEPAEQS